MAETPALAMNMSRRLCWNFVAASRILARLSSLQAKKVMFEELAHWEMTSLADFSFRPVK